MSATAQAYHLTVVCPQANKPKEFEISVKGGVILGHGVSLFYDYVSS